MQTPILKQNEVLQIALTTGEILIKNGAEIVRTEETMQRICVSRGYKEASAFVTTTAIFIGSDSAYGSTYIRNIKRRGSDLYRIMLVNDFSRKFVRNPMTYEDAMSKLKNIEYAKGYPPILMSLGGALGSAAFSLLIGSSMPNLLPCIIITFLAMMLMFKIDSWPIPMLNHLILGMFIASLGVGSTSLGFGESQDMIIISATLPLLPGIPFTNGVRDFMYGDLISGTSRIFESVMIIISISFGVAIIVNMISPWLGGL